MKAERSGKTASPCLVDGASSNRVATALPRVRLSDLADVDPENFDPERPIDFHYIDLGSVSEPGARPETNVINSKNRPSRAQRKTKNGDLLVSNVRPYLRNYSRVEGFPSDQVVVASTGFTVVRPKDPSLGGYIFQSLLSDSFQRWIRPRMTGTGYPAITSKDVHAFPIVLPDGHQPIEVASFLNSINKAVSHTQEIIVQTKVAKAALMQGLLLPDRKSYTKFKVRALGELFGERKESGKPGLPTLSVTMHDGMVDRDDLDRRVESELTPEDHLLAHKHDIAYNMMRMWQGVSGLAPFKGLVSPAYVVLKPLDGIDPLFASYLFKLPETIRLFHRYSQSLTNDRLRLYYDQFAEIRVPIPVDVAEQRRIASLLTTLDRQIEQSESLVAALKQTKAAICQRLFS